MKDLCVQFKKFLQLGLGLVEITMVNMSRNDSESQLSTGSGTRVT